MYKLNIHHHESKSSRFLFATTKIVRFFVIAKFLAVFSVCRLFNGTNCGCVVLNVTLCKQLTPATVCCKGDV